MAEDFAYAVRSLVEHAGIDKVLEQFESPRGLVQAMLDAPPAYARGTAKHQWLIDNQEEAARITAGILGLM